MHTSGTRLGLWKMDYFFAIYSVTESDDVVCGCKTYTGPTIARHAGKEAGKK
jgi:hypothetical protein